MAVEYRKNRGRWGYRFSQAGRNYKQYVWATKTEARKAERDRIKELEDNPPPPPTALSSVVSWYLIDSAAPELERSRHRLDALNWNMKKFILPHFGETTLVGDIKTKQVDDFIRKHRKAGRKPKTVKNLFTDLNALFNYAVQEDLLKVNPAQKANRKLIGNIKPNKPPLNMDEILMMLSVLGDPRVHIKERVYILFAITLGARMDEGNRALWADIRWSTRTIRIQGTKTEGSDVTVSIPPLLFNALVELHSQKEDSEFIFPGESPQTRNKKIYSRRRLFEKITRLSSSCGDCNVVGGIVTRKVCTQCNAVLHRNTCGQCKGKAIKKRCCSHCGSEKVRNGVRLTPKDMRDIYASDAAANTKNPETLMKMMRHTSLATTTKYLRGVDDRMKQAAQNIGQKWIKALNDDGEILEATLGGKLNAEKGGETTSNDILQNHQPRLESPVTTRQSNKKFGGGGWTRTTDAADMSRVL